MSFITDAVGGILKPISDVVDHLTVSGDDKIKIQLALLQAQQSAAEAITTAQSDVDKVEAGNNSMFVAGWRPAVGWVCATALAFEYLVRPLVAAGYSLAHQVAPTLPGIDDNLWQLMFGLLGMGALRSFDKMKGTAVGIK